MSKYGRRKFAGVNATPFTKAKPYSSKSSSHPYGDDWVTQSSLCKKRDNYTCQAHKIGLPKCGARYPGAFSHLLEAHHVIPFRKCKSNNLRNLVTLCKDCHSKTHKHLHHRDSISDKQKLAARRWTT